MQLARADPEFRTESELKTIRKIRGSVHVDGRAGDPELVKRLKRQAFLAGADLKAIRADAFLPSGPS